MSTLLDSQLGLGVESIYGTPVTVTRFFESPVAFDYKPVKVQGTGTRPTKHFARAKRNKLARVEVSGSQDLEVPTSGFGVLLKGALGDVTSAQIGTSGVYQHIFTPTKNDFLDSFTVQGVVPALGGVDSQLTFVGCMIQSLEFSASEGGILTSKLDWVGKDVDENQSTAVASYPDNDIFTFVEGAVVAATVPALTVPGATTLATGLTGPQIAPNVTSFSLKVDNGLDAGGYVLGSAGKRGRKNALGKRAATGKISAEFTGPAMYDAFRKQTRFGIVITFTGAQIGSNAGTPIYATLQIVLPTVQLSSGMPKSTDGSVPVLDGDFEVLDGGVAAQPIYIVYRSTDTAP